MAYIYNNPNPKKRLVGDCVIRGISILTGKSWRNVYVQLLTQLEELRHKIENM